MLSAFRAASRTVGLSPAALGQRIRQLEEQVGAPLFVRSTRKVELTGAGMNLLPSAERADRILHDLVPEGLRTPLHVAFIRLGREICKAPIPRCVQCPLKDLCPTAPRYLGLRAR